MRIRRTCRLLVIGGASLAAVSVSVPASASVTLTISESVALSTTLKSLHQTVQFPTGTFVGELNQQNGKLTGSIDLPPATTQVQLAGIGLADATISVVDLKKVVGRITNVSDADKLSATATVQVRIDSLALAVLPTVNLVGTHCATLKPVTLQMKGPISLFSASTFTGTYTLPDLGHCGAATGALNAVLPGPGNTYSTTMTPSY